MDLSNNLFVEVTDLSANHIDTSSQSNLPLLLTNHVNHDNHKSNTYYDSDSDSGAEETRKERYKQIVNDCENLDLQHKNNFINLNTSFLNNQADTSEEDSKSQESKHSYKISTDEIINNLVHSNKTDISRSELLGILSKLEIDWHDIEAIKDFVDNTFSTNLVSLTSTHLDIIASYLNSQKMIYTESSYYTSTWLNYLMIPTIIISAGASVISGAERIIPHAQLIISCITAFSAFLLSVINYLKLDAASEAHKISAHQYDKLQSHIMFFSGKSLLFSSASFNFNTRPERKAKKLLEVKKNVRLKIDEGVQQKYNELEILKSDYNNHKFTLNKEIQKMNYAKFDCEALLQSTTLDHDKRNEYDNDLNKNIYHIQSLQNDLDQINIQYRIDKKDKKEDIDKFMNNFKKVLNEETEKAIIELNTEETHHQKDLMDKILLEIEDVQKKIKEIKETNQFEVPRTIRNRYPTAYSINVFSLIKMIEDYRLILTIKLWIYRNNLRQIRSCINACTTILESSRHINQQSRKMIENELDRFKIAKVKYAEKKNTIYESIVALSVSYIEIDAILVDELKRGDIKRNMGVFYYLCPCILKYIHDSNWVDNSFINHIYDSASKNVKKLQEIEKKKKESRFTWNIEDDHDINDIMV